MNIHIYIHMYIHIYIHRYTYVYTHIYHQNRIKLYKKKLKNIIPPFYDLESFTKFSINTYINLKKYVLAYNLGVIILIRSKLMLGLIILILSKLMLGLVLSKPMLGLI